MPAEATSQPTAFRIRESLKPAPATPMMDAMIPKDEHIVTSVIEVRWRVLEAVQRSMLHDLPISAMVLYRYQSTTQNITTRVPFGAQNNMGHLVLKMAINSARVKLLLGWQSTTMLTLTHYGLTGQRLSV